MPELPEVEIIKLGLEKKIVGLIIQKIEVLSPKSFIGNPKLAEGQKVLNIFRRAKILGVDLGSHQHSAISSQTKKQKSLTTDDRRLTTLLFHMKMSGQLIYVLSEKRIANSEQRFIGGHPTEDMLGKMPNTHTRVIFSFADGSHLYFNDQRRFGWIKAIENCKLKIENSLGKLGPEPLEKDFTWQILKSNLLRHKSMAVKVAIMDQSVVAGVGNIYANEACFMAGIDPRTKVGTLSDKQFRALYRGIIGALREGIKYGGSTKVHFVDPEGRKGYFLDYAKVYGKEGYSCQARLPDGQGCPGKVEKITLGGRGTFFCPHCQKSSI